MACESRPLQGFDEVTVNLIGSHYDRRHGVLVLRCGGGQKGQCGERDVILTVRETPFIITVWTQTVSRTEQREFWVNLGRTHPSRTVREFPGSGSSVCVCAHFDTREKASAHTAGHGTRRMAIRPRAEG